ncbi:hypothetical protein GII36_00980 [Candidatus Mycosynbacter amalyticus]|uniref:Uncharacterized protein n=1 Tax=Candidatus Mycosynbacter amalyticus TaxID=2665156 RepID=A0A857MIP0_9BACT|nr:hypothetical protein [Candidatus Mycosynbacter amalyticus]QHN42434.1 hypothetical protein GII36_00980 [Candidatus Mycosynbacter amalyticus]
MRHQQRRQTQTGAVSLFVVIFTALLFVAVTVGFTILMLSDQQQSTDNDLAQSALDSANAGTEDAKRVLAQYSDCQERGLNTGSCASIRAALDRNQCNTVNAALGSSSDLSERKVQQTETNDNASALQQAYTCVKITPNTDTYVGKTRSEGDIRLVPLKTDGAAFDTIQISWLKRDDMNLENGNPQFSPLADYADVPAAQRADYLRLPTKADWRNDRRGAVLRVGMMQYQPGSVNLNDLDDKARAVFLYSGSTGLSNTPAGAINLDNADLHRPLTSANQAGLDAKIYNYPYEAHCADVAQGYMCTTFVRIPSGMDTSRFHYLTLASVYRDTSFEVRILNGTNTVQFKNVQPEIDVTGRANDVFRRLVSRVESADASEAPYPRAAVGTNGDICKNFVVTDDPDDYHSDAPSTCADITRP